MARLIGLHGPRGAGKDTAFSLIHEWAEERGVRARRRGFADALKLSFARLFIPDISREEAVVWCDRLKHTGVLSLADIESTETQETVLTHTISGRTALQRYGTEAHRDVLGKNFWIDVLLPVSFEEDAWATGFMDTFDQAPPDIAVITDVRFENEAERIHQLGGQVWRINRPDMESSDDHASEVPLADDLVDDSINNIENDLSVMKSSIEFLLESLLV